MLIKYTEKCTQNTDDNILKLNMCTGFQLDVIELKKEGLTKVIKLTTCSKPKKIPVPIPRPLIVLFTFMSSTVKDRTSLSLPNKDQC